MKFGFKVEGISTVIGKLNTQIKETTGLTTQGLLAAGLFVQRAAQKKVPVEYGVLRASAYTRKDPARAFLAIAPVEVGFSAAYALYVHENMEQKLKGEPRPSGLGVYWGPHGEPKFLENALRESVKDILQIVQKRAKINGGKR